MNDFRKFFSSTLGSLCLLGAAVGCGDPIHMPVPIAAAATRVDLAPAHDEAFYEWPLTRSGYVVSRPPQMAFLTAFDEKLTCPDPVSAELVPWTREGLDASMVEILDDAYQPPQSELEPVLKLESSQFAGPSAFDVSADGSRLVVVDAQGLALYNAKDGSLIGRRKLPLELTAMSSPATAVRFCGDSKALLVACQETIVRLSSKDGSVTGQVDGIGEAIAQWDVTADGTSMLIRGTSGKIFGGDSQLQSFSAYELGSNATFDAASLSPDGSRIGVVANRQPRIYFQKTHKIVGKIDQPQVTFDPDVAVAMGTTSDAWIDGDTLCFTTVDAEETRRWGAYEMFWKPLQISTTINPKGNSYLIVGRRIFRGQKQIILYDFGAIGRAHSLPQVLDEVPIRFAHSRLGDVVAIADSRGLHLCHRPTWRPYAPIFVEEAVYQWLNEKQFSGLEKLVSIISSQDRLGFGKTSEELKTAIIEAMANRWWYLSEKDPESEILAALEQWAQEGSQIALVAKGLHHYKRAWAHRGSGLAGTVTQQGWEGYQHHLKLAIDELDKVLAMDSPPLIAIKTRVEAGLEDTGELDQADPLCRLACELYPGEVAPHESLAFKLMPQWFGEPGDTLSFMSSVARMYEEPHGDYLYMRLVSTTTSYLDKRDSVGWKSFDPIRVRRGVQECIRREANNTDDLWSLWMQTIGRANDASGAELILTHLMETTAVAPSWMTEGESQRTFVSMIMLTAENVWKH